MSEFAKEVLLDTRVRTGNGLSGTILFAKPKTPIFLNKVSRA